ncbi:MAG: hypothetical protein EOP82_18400 [Variovorax sp.]|nr:MAG: hypothetical protein EOP82_18400 [Variovorax sp.]
MTLEFHPPPHPLAAALMLAAVLALPAAASAQDGHSTGKAPPRDSKVLGGIQRGADATGRGIDRAGQATQHGVNTASERASRPLRNAGESLGRKLSLGSSGRSAPPAVGPQGSAP